MVGKQPTATMFAPTQVLVVGLVVTGVWRPARLGCRCGHSNCRPAQQVALLFAAEPAIAAWLAWYFLGENLDAQGWFGSVMIPWAVSCLVRGYQGGAATQATSVLYVRREGRGSEVRE